MPEENTPAASTPFTRRRLLGGGAAVAAATAALALPGNVRRALAEPLPSKQPKLSDIKHVVLLMQENRRFDHYFGTFPGVRGFADPKMPIQKSGTQAGKSVLYQPDPYNTSGYLLPWHLDTLTTGAQAIPSTSQRRPGHRQRRDRRQGHLEVLRRVPGRGGRLLEVLPGADNYGTNVLEFMHQFQNAPTTSSLYKNAMTTQPYGQFEIDAMNDNLPTVSWLTSGSPPPRR